MKVNHPLLYTSSLALVLTVANPVQAGWLDFLGSSAEDAAKAEAGAKVDSSVDALGNSVQIKTNTDVNADIANMKSAAQTTQSDLTALLMQRTGVTQAQAQGGAGAMFQVAKQRMTDEAFGQLSQTVPGMDAYLAAAPQVKTNPVGGLAGGLLGAADTATGGAVGNATTLISAFKQLDLSQDMVTQFTPVLVDYVKQQGNPQLSALLQVALTGSGN